MTCTRCHAETAQGMTLCAHCEQTLIITLDNIPDALDTAHDTVARQDATGGTGGGAGDPAKPPVNLTALEAVTNLQEITGSWARMVLEDDSRNDLRNVGSVAYLKMGLPIIRKADYAADLCNELHDALVTVQRVTDRPPEVVNLGQCWASDEDGQRCPGVVRRIGTNDIARCNHCRESHDARSLKEHLRNEGTEALAPLSVIVKALRGAGGVNIAQKSAERWVAEGHLKSEHKDHRGVRLFTARQVIDAAASRPMGRPRKEAPKNRKVEV